ncbi:lamin-like protein [Vigna radiata var. radiata]|uniref:Lamin-like protein n=1 Tax=Vigna radiata var. radiata TaxID=3916 RepID=A0A3Q0FA92_VIGRR|nr:lamin-like protein [Vigna radiata var. radiata]
MRKIIIYLLMTITIGCYKVEGREPILHRVGGGRYTWTPKTNFTQWASYEHFYKGDWLYFGFDKSLHNVLEVNKTNYENCIDTNFIQNITKGGRDVVQLLEARTYYFLCGRGFCFEGMKIAINVEEPTFKPSPSALSNKALHSSSIINTKLILFLVTVLWWPSLSVWVWRSLAVFVVGVFVLRNDDFFDEVDGSSLSFDKVHI